MAKTWTRDKIYSQAHAEARAAVNKAERAVELRYPNAQELYDKALVKLTALKQGS